MTIDEYKSTDVFIWMKQSQHANTQNFMSVVKAKVCLRETFVSCNQRDSTSSWGFIFEVFEFAARLIPRKVAKRNC